MNLRAWVLRWTLVAGLALTINAGFYARNLGAYGSPLGAATNQVASADHSCHQIWGNLIRNVASNLGTPLPSWNRFVKEHTTRLAGPGPLFANLPFDVTFSLYEDDTGNLPQLLLAVFCIALFPWRRGAEKALTGSLLAVVGLSLLLLCALLLWQPWITRFHTFLFLLLAPVCAWALDRTPRLGLLCAFGLWCYALPFLLFNVSRPVISMEVLRAVAPAEAQPMLRFRPSVFLAPRMNQCFGRYVDTRREYEAAMQWLPRDPQAVTEFCNDGTEPELFLWLVAEQRLGGRVPRLIPLLAAPETPQVPATQPVVLDSRRPAARCCPSGYRPAFEGRDISVWTRTNNSGK